MGTFNSAGFDFYFVACFFLKGTVSFILLALSAIATLPLIWRQEKREGRLSFSTLNLYFILTYLILASFCGLNMGIRHILPIFLPIIVLIIEFFTYLERITKFSHRKWLRLLMFSFAGFHLLESLHIHPHYVSFFNCWVTPERGHLFLSDSNIDWGQDLKRLADWRGKNPGGLFYLDYFGGGDPRFYFGEEFIPWSLHRGLPNNGILAVSLYHYIQGRYWKKIGFFQRDYSELFEREKPIGKIGHSIYIFRLK